MRIYCVDDNYFHLKKSRELAEATCQSRNILDYEIVECQNGEELIEGAKAAPPDLVMLDINMPVLDGLSTLVRFRHCYPDLKTRIVMLSSENKTLIRRFADPTRKQIEEDERKQELLKKVIDRVKTGLEAPGKINSVLEACANLSLDPAIVAKNHGANGFITKPFEIEPATKTLASLI